MKIIIKGRKQLKVNPRLQSYIEEKVLKYEDQIEEPSICEVVLSEKFRGPKRGLDKNIHLTMTLPGLKNPIHIKARGDDFLGMMDLIQADLEKQMNRLKEKKTGSRFPLKYWAAKMMETGAAGPRWLWRKIRRKKLE